VNDGNTARERDTGAKKTGLRGVDGGKQAMKSESLDTLIHERARLAIVSALAVNDTLSFAELKHSLGLSDGNLSVHAQKLEAAGYLRCKKSFRGRTPRSDFRLTAKGRKALDTYLGHMEALIKVVRKP